MQRKDQLKQWSFAVAVVAFGTSGCGQNGDTTAQNPKPAAVKVAKAVIPRPTPKPTALPTRAERRRLRAEARRRKREAKAKAREQAKAARIAAASSAQTETTEESNAGSSSGEFSGSSDEAAMQDLRSNSWVKDLYVSPGHTNIGVIAGEKDWTAPMISSYACGVLRKHGSKLDRVRFVDIEAVANEGKSPNQAEIYSTSCP